MDANQKIELVKIGSQVIASVAWPSATLCFLWIYKAPVSGFIDRLQKFRGSFFEATTVGQGNQQEDKPSNLSELEKIISPEVVALNIEQAKNLFMPLLGTGKDREESLFKIISSMSIAIRYHQAYSLIFGSQLNLLFDLNSKVAGSLVEARTFYDHATRQFPETYKAYSFEQWMGYLSFHGLVQVMGETVSLTVVGKGFLNFLIQQKMSVNRPN